MHPAQSHINHVALVLDASWSMKDLESTTRKVIAGLIKDLNDISQEKNQETRVSVYRFGDSTIACELFDMDVARLPSADSMYSVLYESTALIDAFLLSQEELATTSQLHGDHAFLTYVLTDGQENRSKRRPSDMKRALQNAAVNWTVGFLVPDQNGVRYMEQMGALRDAIAVWDATSAKGLMDAGVKIRTATENFMTARAAGVRGTRSVFGTGLDVVNKRSVKTNLEPLKASEFTLLQANTGPLQIRDFVTTALGKYVRGNAYYLLRKKETIQPSKTVIIVEKSTGKAYTGEQVRAMLGLPDGEYVDVRPDYNPNYDIYVQSKSVNRKVEANDKLLVRS